MKEKRRRLALAATMLAVLALGVAGGVTAASGQDTVVADAALEPGMAFDGPLMIELEGEPATAAYAEARGRGASNAAAGRAGKAQKEANERAQASVLAAIRAQGISADPLYQVQTSYNGIAVNADPGTAAELAALPGVKAVHVIPVQSLDNHYTVPLIGALDAWESTGKTGAGVSIAVIDTGVDYVHRGFGGSGSSADYSAAQSPANNPSPWSSSNSSSFSIPGIYPTAKVVGGFDFAGDTYNASDPAAPINPVPRPDPNPLDCNGHGSHVAGTAAGTGVSEDGTTYTGPYDSSLDTASMDIGPGVAPKAEIYALRVFGCNGNTALTVQAINWAADPNGDGDPSDHVDIINMSLGSAYGTADDPSAAAVNNAVNAGVMVVTSAGNNTDVYYVTSSPGSATGAMATASSADESDRADAILIHEPAAIAGPAVASKSVAFNWAAVPERTGNVYYPASNQYGCSPWSAAEAAKISGRIVLVDWKLPTDATFPCGSAVRANNATAAGATGIIMADSVPFLDTAISGNASTPGMYTTSTVGNRLKSQLSPGVISGVNVTLSSLVVAEGFATGRDDTLSSFSSRGPRRGSALKPDIAAPGHSIWSVDRLTGNRGRSLNGTSMASPHMAGVSALLLEAHPTWAPSEIKALAMNTAKNDVYLEFNRSGPKYGVGRVGAGRVDVPAALESTSIAFNADEPRAVSVSFGAVEVAGTLTRSKTIRVVNRGSAAQTYTVGYDARTSIPGVSYSFPDGTSLSVPAGGSATFRVQLNADASAMQNTRDATVAGVQTGNPRHWLAEASGLVLVSPASGPQLRVPVYATARPASTSKAAAPFVNLPGGSTTGRINIAGEGVNTGPEPSGWLSKVSAFELGIQSPRRESLPTGFPAQTRHADVQYAGAATKGTNVYFGISTWEDWSTAATEQQLTVQIDRDGNGTADFHVFNTRFTDTDTFVAAGQRLNAPPTPNSPLTAFGFTNIFNSNVNTAPFNNNVVVYGVPITQIGLPAGQTSFRYRVVGFSRFWGTVDTTDWARYDVANPGLSFSDGLAGTTMYPSLDGQKIDVTYDAADYAANESKGVLLLFHLNESGKRTEVLQIRR